MPEASWRDERINYPKLETLFRICMFFGRGDLLMLDSSNVGFAGVKINRYVRSADAKASGIYPPIGGLTVYQVVFFKCLSLER